GSQPADCPDQANHRSAQGEAGRADFHRTWESERLAVGSLKVVDWIAGIDQYRALTELFQSGHSKCPRIQNHPIGDMPVQHAGLTLARSDDSNFPSDGGAMPFNGLV
ncbi:MAG: hypothetical protein ABI845_11235, partial [Polaromonas sp.]